MMAAAAIPALVEAAPIAAAALPTLAELGPFLATYGPLLLQAPALINGCIDLGRRLHGTYQEASANAPAARYEALQKYREESKQNHEESLRRMKELHQRIGQTAKDQEEAADRRIGEQIRARDETLNALRETMKKDEDTRRENMRKMKEDHEIKIREIQNETKEEKQRMEKEHADKMERMAKEHTEEKEEAERKLEEARKEAAERIEKAEAEKERVVKERDQALDLYREQMETLTRMNHEQVTLILQETEDLRIENAREKGRQLEERHQATLRQLQEQTAQYVRHLRLETNRGVVTKFQALMEPIHDITNSLEAIHNQCSPPIPGQEALIIVPVGNLDTAFQILRAQREVYQSRLTRYQQHIRNCPQVHPEIHQACRNLITNMTSNIQNQDISRLLTHLPGASDSGNSAVIAHYGQVAGTVRDQFRVLCATVGDTLDRVTSHLHEQEALPEANVAAIEDNLQE